MSAGRYDHESRVPHRKLQGTGMDGGETRNSSVLFGVDDPQRPVATPPFLCDSCATPIPVGALRCASCGAETPTQISIDTEHGVGPVRPAGDRRGELQSAIGATYEVTRRIGAGGFAEVYEAWEPRLKRRVAIKLLNSELTSSPSMLNRFRREAEAVAQLRHPNIVPIYSIGDGEGCAWYVMPLVEGETLRERLAREQVLDHREASRVLRDVAAALAVAHRAGIVHRDVKPENVMFDGQERRVLLMDFGIAKALSASPAADGLTGTGIAVGTPRYMSPEQAAGESVGPASDVYSLGIVGYEMLAGQPPFAGTSFREIMVKQATEDPPPLGELAPGAPEALVATIGRALDRDPAKRFPSAVELGAAFELPATGPASLSSPTLNVAESAPPWMKWALLALGVAGFAITAWRGFDADPWMRATGISRDRAQEIASEFFYAHGAKGTFERTVARRRQDSVVALLSAAMSPVKAQEWSRKFYPVDEWHVRWYGHRETWNLALDLNGRVRRFRHWRRVEEGDGGGNRDSSLAAAMRMIKEAGLDSLKLARKPLARDSGGLHSLAWSVTGDSIRWSGISVSREIRAHMHGARVISLDHRMVLPDSFHKALKRHDESVGRSLLLVAIPLGFVLISGLQIRRRGVHTTRWRQAQSLSFVGGGLVLLSRVASWNADRLTSGKITGADPVWLPWLFAVFAAIIVMYVATLLITVVDEDVRSKYPGVVAGVLELGQGRVLSRPMASAWIPAYGLGGALLAIGTLTTALVADRAELISVAQTNPLINALIPLAAVTWVPVVALGLCVVVVACLLTVARLTSKEIAPFGVVIALALMEATTASGSPVVQVGMALLGYGLGAFVLLRWGLLATALGIYVVGVASTAMELFAQGAPIRGSITLALLGLPLLLGLLSKRRYGVLLTPTPSRATPVITSP